MFGLTYGAIISDMIRHHNSEVSTINAKLYDMGMRLGERMADEFLAYRTNEICSSIKDVGDRLVKASRVLTVGIEILSECKL